MYLNKVILVGRLTRDPETRTLPSGDSVVNFGLATNRVWKDKDGNKQEQVEFHNIVAFGRLADIAAQYLNKGALCLVVGRLQTRSWQAQDGNQRSRTEIIMEEMQLGPRTSSFEASEKSPAKGDKKTSKLKGKKKEAEPEAAEEEEVDVEDIPF